MENSSTDQKKKTTVAKTSSTVLKSSKNKRINLLSDTGLAIRQANFLKRINIVSGFITFLSLLFLAGNFAYWYNVDREHTKLQDQIELYEQQIKQNVESAKIAKTFKKRLQSANSIYENRDETQTPWFMFREIMSLASTHQSTVGDYAFDKDNNLFVQFSIPTLVVTDNLFIDLLEKEDSQLLNDILIDSFSRSETYEVSLMADIPKEKIQKKE